MIKLYNQGIFLIHGKGIDTDSHVGADEAKKGTMAWRILEAHNTSSDMSDLCIAFDQLVSHDITFVGIIQTARASGLEKFPVPYVLTNCHNSLCAVGGTINEDDHMFGLSCAKRYGGIYVPPHQAVIHQYAREQMAGVGKMILGSDSHTRYGALGTMAVGEGGPELVKQLLGRTYDISMPEIVAVYLEGAPRKGVGPQDVALAIIKETFTNGFVNNKIMEFVGPGVKNLSADFRIGIDVMTTETTCLSSIWQTDEVIREYYEIHGRVEEYKTLTPLDVAYYDRMIHVSLGDIVPMIAMPFHPSNAYTIDEVNSNLTDIVEEVEKRALVSLENEIPYSLREKVKDGKFYVDQGIIAGCAGGGFENICASADILQGKYTGDGVFTLSVYPASTPIYMELVKNGVAADLLASGAVIKTAFCGPCFGAGDTPANQGFSIRHTTRNFPNREGSKLQNGQISSVALMDARSIAATAANQGILTPATHMDTEYKGRTYFFDSRIYENRVFNSLGKPDIHEEITFGPNIKDWPDIPALSDNMVIRIVSEIHDPVTTTDELIPSGETSSYRSNPMGLAEFTLSRKDPAYVEKAKEIQRIQQEMLRGESSEIPESAHALMEIIRTRFPGAEWTNTCIGSAIFAVKPGDGSAREQAASCQRVLGGWANIACEYATKRYRSNLINWGLLPLVTGEDHRALSFQNGDYLFIPQIKRHISEKSREIEAFIINKSMKQTVFGLEEMTEKERNILIKGCLINEYKENYRKSIYIKKT